jgi:hypothetical protein
VKLGRCKQGKILNLSIIWHPPLSWTTIQGSTPTGSI